MEVPIEVGIAGLIGLVIGVILGSLMMKGHVENMKKTAMRETVRSVQEVVASAEFAEAIISLTESRIVKSSSPGLFSGFTKGSTSHE